MALETASKELESSDTLGFERERIRDEYVVRVDGYAPFLHDKDKEAILQGVSSDRFDPEKAKENLRTLGIALEGARKRYEAFEKAFRDPLFEVLKARYPIKEMTMAEKTKAWERLQKEMAMIREFKKRIKEVAKKGLMSRENATHKRKQFTLLPFDEKIRALPNFDSELELDKREALFERFKKLPKPVQKQFKEQMFAIPLAEIPKLLDDIEQKRTHLIEKYRGEIREAQGLDQNGLSLFSTVDETVAGSSVNRYINWFSNKLSLDEMEHPEKTNSYDPKCAFKSPQRLALRTQMAEILKTLPENEQEAGRQKFNELEMTGRQLLIARYGKPQAKKGLASKPAVSEKAAADWISAAAKDVAMSGSYEAVRQALDTAAIEQEIYTREKRASLRYHRSTVSGLQEAMRDEEEKRVVDENEKIAEAGPQKPREDDILKLKRTELRHHSDTRSSLKRALKPGMGRPNEMMFNAQFMTESGRELNVEEAKTEVARAQEEVIDRIAPILVLRSKSEMPDLDEREIREGLKKANLRRIEEERLRNAA